MIRAALTLWIALTASMAAAQDSAGSCPDFYRFVDFGLTDAQGGRHAGGKYLRVENFDGTPMVRFQDMTCLDLPNIRTDGRGNQIPVVDRALYDPSVLPSVLLEGVTDLRVERDEGLRDAAFAQVDLFQSLMFLSDPRVVRGPDFLCVAAPAGPALMCQFQQVYDGPNVGDIPLYVICDAGLCSLTALPVDAVLNLTATWLAPPNLSDDPRQSAPLLFDKVLEIKAFIDALL